MNYYENFKVLFLLNIFRKPLLLLIQLTIWSKIYCDGEGALR